MGKPEVWKAALCAAACLACAAEAGAFIPRLDFLPLSNYELVKAADEIVLAKAVEYHPRDGRIIRFEVIRSIKGTYKQRELLAYGTLDPEHYHGPSEAGVFSRARPGTYAGSGSAYDYQAGKTYLLFLKKRPMHAGFDKDMYALQIEKDQCWQVGVQALSRDREEVAGKEDPWLKAVELYAAIAATGDHEKEAGQLRALATRAKGDPKGGHPAGMAADIERHFLTVSPMKSYQDLIVLQRGVKDVDGGERILFAMAQAFHAEAFDQIRRAAAEKYADIFIHYFLKVEHNDRDAALIEMVPLLRDEDNRRAAMRVLMREKSGLAEDQLLKLMPCLSVDQAASNALVAEWVKAHPTQNSVSMLRARVGTEYGKEGRQTMVWLLTALADGDVVKWAVMHVDDRENRMATYVIAYSPTEAGFEAGKRLIEQGDAAKLRVFRQMLQSGDNNNPRRGDLLKLLPEERKTDRQP